MRKNLPNTSVPCGCRRRAGTWEVLFGTNTGSLGAAGICCSYLHPKVDEGPYSEMSSKNSSIHRYVAFFDLPRRPLGDSVYFRTSGVTQSFIWDWLCDWIERDLSEPVCCFLRGLCWLLFLSLRQGTWQKQFHRESVYLGSQLEVQLIDGSRR